MVLFVKINVGCDINCLYLFIVMVKEVVEKLVVKGLM